MIKIYGSRISYYAGKLEAYLRYRGHAFERKPMSLHRRELIENAGAVQSPVIQLEDGRWLSDTTPILAWFEGQRSGPTIYPEDPALRFAALLIEDHADEWLWRPAMHYRWSFPLDRAYASRILAEEQMSGMKGPGFLKRWQVAVRQRTGFVKKDGVDAETWDHQEATTMAAFMGLERVFEERPFLLGDRPTIADYGFMGPMFRHYAQDPGPQELMREHAPRVYAWVARMWLAEPSPDDAALIDDVDAPIAAILREACETHLLQLRENARAYAEGRTHFDQEIQGVRYRNLPVSRYRVWCLEELRREWKALEVAAQERLRPHLEGPGAEILWSDAPAARSDYDPERKAPFNRAINVFGDGVPR